jgi:putative transposase
VSRAARQVYPDIPHHVTARGARRAPTFFGPEDYAFYLRLLRRGCRKSSTSVWAWCLMPNHLHLILAPSLQAGLRTALAPAQRLYALEINRRQSWTGHFWQGRFASWPMDEAHLHVCFRYVELNPVRAGLVDRPEDWRWSSARAHLGLSEDGLTDLAPARERIADWGALLDAGLDDADREAIRDAERSGRFRRR